VTRVFIQVSQLMLREDLRNIKIRKADTILAQNKLLKSYILISKHGLKYKSIFFSQTKFNREEADKYSKIKNSITLITKSKKYPLGHYLLRTKDGWIDPWHNLPSIDKIEAGIRKELPGNPWYVLYPI